MPQLSKIEWTDYTWNPVTGCRKVSPACQNCYAERIAERFRGVPNHPFRQGFDVKLWPERISLPLGWKQPRRIFVNSMSDLFLEDLPNDFIGRIVRTMEKAPWHSFQVLTKRPKRMVEWVENWLKKGSRQWARNIWLGVSVESPDYMWRVDFLRQTPAMVRFVSFEPLLEGMRLQPKSLHGIQWVIVGGESGQNARLMRKKWVEEIFAVARKEGIPFFFKQWGTFNSGGIKVGKTKAGRIFRGRIWNEVPLAAEDGIKPRMEKL
jgi:protein gp37